MTEHNIDREVPEKILLFIFEHNINNIPVSYETLYNELDLSEYKPFLGCSNDLIRLSLEKLFRINMVFEEPEGYLAIKPSYLSYVGNIFENQELLKGVD